MSKHSLQQTSAQETTVAPPTYLNEAGMTSGNRCICSFAPPHGLTPTIRDHASSNHSNVGYFISTNVNSEGGNCATSVPSQSKVLTRTRHRVISESSFVPPRGFTLTGEDHASNHFLMSKPSLQQMPTQTMAIAPPRYLRKARSYLEDGIG
jgi:hypothetical protein